MRRIESVARRRDVGGDSTARISHDRIAIGGLTDAITAVTIRCDCATTFFAAVASVFPAGFAQSG